MPRILVVDDEPAALRLVTRALSHRGYEVHAASSPAQALQVARIAPCFDLLLSDVIMPEMCGPELALKIAEFCPAAAVILMSGHIACEKLPPRAAFIGKPFLLADLYAVVERTLPSPPPA